jgi:hypothetical protein
MITAARGLRREQGADGDAGGKTGSAEDLGSDEDAHGAALDCGETGGLGARRVHC